MDKGSQRSSFQRAGLVFLLLAVGGLFPGGAGAKTEDSLEDWREGPVRYLMTRKEWKGYRTLKTTSERMEFIRHFWERRDPDPRTPHNEARLAFWNRVLEANFKFGDTPKPGWKTDRGKIYILLGPPDEIEKKEFYDAQIKTIANRGLMRWHYRGLTRAVIRAATVVAFIRGNDDDWYLTDDARFNSPTFDINRPVEEISLPPMDRLLAQIPWRHASMGTALDLGRLQEVPTEREILRAVVDAEQFLGTMKTEVEVHSLTDPQGNRLLAITGAVPKADLFPPWDGSATSLAIRFGVTATLKSPSGDVIEIPEEAFVAEPAPSPDDLYLRVQAIRPIPPGDWKLSLVMFDRPGGGAGTIAREIQIPPVPPEGTLRFEGPVLISNVFQPGGTLSGGGAFPFHWSGQGVVPRVFRQIKSGEKVRAAFRLTAVGEPVEDVTVVWAVENHNGSLPSVQPEITRTQTGDILLLEFDPASLPPGTYRLRITASPPSAAPITEITDFEIPPR